MRGGLWGEIEMEEGKERGNERGTPRVFITMASLRRFVLHRVN